MKFRRLREAISKVLPFQKHIRRILDSRIFSDYTRLRLRGMGETFLREKDLRSSRGFYYPSRSVIGIKSDIDGKWNDFEFILKYLPTARMIIEVGANIGMDTMTLAKQYGASSVFAYEPSERYLKFLKKNTAGLSNVSIFPYFISDKREKVRLHSNSTSASVIQDIISSLPTIYSQAKETNTLDDLCGGLEQLDLLKIDTDGCDYKVLLGARDTIKRFRPYLVVEFSGCFLERVGSSLRELVVLLEEYGYHRFIVQTEGLEEIDAEQLMKRIHNNSSRDVFCIPG